MATLEEVIAAAHLEAFELPQWDRRLPLWPLHVTPEFIKWADHTPALHDKKLAVGGRTIFEHLLITLCDLRCLKNFHAGDLRRLMPTNKGLWSLHAPKLRVYGWCPGKHHFVAVTAALEADTKSDKTLNGKKRDEVQTFIKAHKLEETILRGDISVVFPHQS
jgi:hypothetical protein